MSRKCWSEEEILLLKNIYPITCDLDIVDFFPCRTLTSIKVKAKKIKIYRKKEIKILNRSNQTTGDKNGMFGRTSLKKNKTYDELYGKEKSKSIRNKLSEVKIGSEGMSGKDNPMYGKIPYNKGKSPSQKVKNKIREGVNNYWKNLSEEDYNKRINQLREDWVIKRDKFPVSDTLPEKITENILIELNINYEKKVNVKYYNCDFIVNNFIIEVQGDYWHGNPIIYETFDVIQTKNKNRDKRKYSFLTNRGYEVIYLWEYDLKNKLEYCKKLLENKLYIK